MQGKKCHALMRGMSLYSACPICVPAIVPRTGFRLRQILLASALSALISAPAFAADAGKASRFYEDALARYQRRDYTGSVIQLKNALQQDRKILAAQVLLGKSLLALGDSVGAETAFNTAIELGVDRAEVELPLAQALYAQGRFTDLLARPCPAACPIRCDRSF